MQTLKNLCDAFVGESQARNRYTMYSKIAIKEGYQAVAANFELTATQEAEHAKWLMRMIQELKEGEEPVLIETGVATTLGTTVENLKAAIGGEHHEHQNMYPEYAKQAEEEGYDKIAERLRSIAKAEENHEERYKQHLVAIENGTMFKAEEAVVWQCRKCGYMHAGQEAPEECPSCDHPQEYFERK
jgi:rubrerythrin